MFSVQPKDYCNQNWFIVPLFSPRYIAIRIFVRFVPSQIDAFMVCLRLDV